MEVEISFSEESVAKSYAMVLLWITSTRYERVILPRLLL
jgi:hypothetical protein